MSETRKHSARIFVAINSEAYTFRLYSPSEYPGESASPGTYRVNLNGKWLGPVKKKLFMTPAAIGELVAGRLIGERLTFSEPRPTGFDQPCRALIPAPEPQIEEHIITGINADETLPPSRPMQSGRSAWTITPPHLGPDGRWWIWVSLGVSKRLVPVNDLVKLRR